MLATAYQEYMYGLIETVLSDIGPRESCGENERRLGQHLAALWSALGHEVRTERFTCHPKAFLGFIPFSALLYLAATVCYWVAPILCFLLAGAAAALIVFELLRYRELVDRLFPAAEGENVIAIVRPRSDVRRRVVVSAHQDSAYEFNLWFFLKNAALPIMVLGFAAVLVPLLGGLAKSLAGSAADSHAFTVVGYVCVALYPFVGLNFFFHTYSVVPGAMDDLAGISVLAGVAKALADGCRDGEPMLEHTEVRLLATSSEEAGLRGAKRYVRAHQHELTQIPSYGVFVDGVYDERCLTVITRELFTGARHDARLIELARTVAARRGWPIGEHMIPLGASDAAAFSLAGVPSVCLLCQDTARLAPNYHTRLDTIEHVRPESLRVMLQMVLDMIAHIDAHDLVPPHVGNSTPAAEAAWRIE
jgi:aminopeptidase YwaD